MPEKEKICPYMTRILPAYLPSHGNRFDHDIFPVPCMKHECELWTVMWTTELPHKEEGCAHRLNAEKNSEGRILV